ncbi:MAG: hypothetical protein EPN82_14615 [Bacteroidetes bacterium]|nr:MAG: hypothetical protein EPN82_14615 [Bacteroidota bacterium]
MASFKPNDFRNTIPNTTSKSVLLFLYKVLNGINLNNYDFEIGDRESLLTNNIIVPYLNHKANEDNFQFTFNSNPGNKMNQSNVDIGVVTFSNYKIIFTIECKRLPTPKGSNRCEKEYVCGKLGGIERFKRNTHGVDIYGNPIKINAMLGYIEMEDFEYWFEKINKWIEEKAQQENSELIWTNNDKLRKKEFNKIAISYSSHKRIDLSNLKLYHFWIKLCDN